MNKPAVHKCPQCAGTASDMGAYFRCLACGTMYTYDERGRPLLKKGDSRKPLTEAELLERSNRLSVEIDAAEQKRKAEARKHKDVIESLKTEWRDVQSALKKLRSL